MVMNTSSCAQYTQWKGKKISLFPEYYLTAGSEEYKNSYLEVFYQKKMPAFSREIMQTQ